MKTIRVDFSKKFLKTICRQGEQNTVELSFVVPADFAGADYVNAEFKKPSGKKEIVELLDLAGVVVPMTEALTCEAGRIGIQLTAYKVKGDEIIEIAKSPIVYPVIERSLGGSHYAGESVIERIIAFINEWREKLVEMWRDKHTHSNKNLLDNLKADDVGIKPDWGENDEESKNHIANRTHWRENEQVITDYTVEWVGTTPTYQAQPWAADNLGITLNEGETYTLQADGATITDVCKKLTMTDQGFTQDYYYIGNLHIFDPSVEDNGFPMLLVMDNMWQNGEIVKTWNLVLTSDTLFGNDLSFSLGKTDTVYHPLAMNYMPDGVIDGFSTTEAYPFTFLKHDGHTIPQHQINDVEPTTQSNDYTVPWLKPNVWNRFGSKDSPVRSISILELEQVDNSVAEEYLVEFWTGTYPPSPVIFPADVEWPDGAEPVWAANKHYQVSVVGSMGLYAESDYWEGEV